MNSIHELHEIMAQYVGLPPQDVPMELPPSAELGDVSFSLFKAAKVMNRSAFELATGVANKLRNLEGVTSTAATNGFLNVTVQFGVLVGHINRLLEHEQQFLPNIGLGRRIMVEYFSPNTNKPLHVGHLRNLFIGEALSRLLTCLGYNVIRANLYNDRGIHISKAQLAYERFGKSATPVDLNKKGDHFVGEYYVLFGKKAEADPDLEEEAQNVLRRWESEDPATLAGWKRMRDWVLQGMGETLDQLGIQPFDVVYYESEFWKKGVEIVRFGREKGIFRMGEAGATVAEIPGIGVRPVLRSDGTALYITQDLHLAIRKVKEFGPLERSIYVVAAEQREHFKVLFSILKQLGYEWANACFHLGYGMILIKGGKLKSREGITADADSMLENLKQMAGQEVRNRQPSLSERQIEERASAIAVSVLKWEFLKVNTLSDIKFSFETSLSMNGDTGPYLLYTYARTRSLQRKSGQRRSLKISGDAIGVLPAEKQIALLINLYPDVLQRAAHTYNLAPLTNHLRQLADRFNTYYQSVKINDEDQIVAHHRQSLSMAAGYTIKQGLDILGIQTLEEM